MLRATPQDIVLPVQRKVEELLTYQIGVEAGHFFSGGITQSLSELSTTLPGVVSETSATSSEGRGISHPAQRPCFLRVRIRKPPPAQKRIFFIRHGQSEWNRATEETYNLREVLALDHPLSSRGVAESEALRRRVNRTATVTPHSTAEALVEANEFLSAPVVISSPLTRALQTAMVALRDHPTVKVHGIRLASDARELKNTVSFDTISSSRGDAVADRSRRKLTIMSKLDRERARRAKAGAEAAGGDEAEVEAAEAAAIPHGVAPVHRWTTIAVDAADAKDRWWDLIETPGEKLEHVRHLMLTLRMLPHRTAIVVGHSLCFKAMLERFGASAVPEATFHRRRQRHVSEPAGVSDDFKYRKLENCAVVALDLDFSYGLDEHLGDAGAPTAKARGNDLENNQNSSAADGGIYKPIRKARLMFGSGFK